MRNVLSLDNTIVEAYRLASDCYIELEEYEKAVQILADGIEVTEARELVAREKYLQEHIVVVEQKLDFYGENGYINYYYTYELEYDTFGYLRKCVVYDADGKVYQVIQYDTMGNITGKTEYYGDIRREYEYDVEGNLTKYTRYENGQTVGWCKYEYDAKGNPIKETGYIFNAFGEPSEGGWNIYEYDEKGNVTKCTYYKANGNIYGWTEYEYNPLNRECKSSYFSEGHTALRTVGGVEVYYCTSTYQYQYTGD